MSEDDLGTIKDEIVLTVGKSGQHSFSATLYDNYGFRKELPLHIRATKEVWSAQRLDYNVFVSL